MPRGARNPTPPKPAADRNPACGVTAVAGHLRGQVRQLSGEILEAIARLDAARPGGKPRSSVPADVALHVEQLFENLGIGEHEKAAVPIDLARKLARDEDTSVAARATKLLRSLDGIGEDERWNYYHRFGM